MGTVESITSRLKAERHDVTVQCRVTATDSELLDEFVAFLDTVGVASNRSSAVRALVLDGLEAFKEFRAEQKPVELKKVTDD